jgi:predicted ferric reductase
MKKAILALIFFGNLIAIIALWWLGSGPLITTGDNASIFIGLGRLVGLLAEFFILIQLILIGRIRMVERLFGFDKLNRIHRLIGYTWAICVPLHPLLLTLGYAMTSNVSLWSQLVDFIFNWEDVWKAIVGLILMIGIIIVSISIIRKKLRYETWYFTHVFMYLGIFLVFQHQIKNGDTSVGIFLQYWLIVNFSVFGLVLIYRFMRPLYLAWKHQFTIEKIVEENSIVASVYISGKHIEQYHFEAGQYAHITFLAWGKWYTHPFSFSAAPNENYLRLSIKRSGDFTKQIQQLPVHTRVIIDGPFGVFTERSAITKKFLFIAAGIGITPIYALIESLSKRQADMVLLYGNKNKEQAIFIDELQTLPVKKHLIFSQEEIRGYEHGHIDKEKVIRLVNDIKDRDVYICGPDGFMQETIQTVIDLGVPKKQIHFERFGY